MKNVIIWVVMVFLLFPMVCGDACLTGDSDCDRYGSINEVLSLMSQWTSSTSSVTISDVFLLVGLPLQSCTTDCYPPTPDHFQGDTILNIRPWPLTAENEPFIKAARKMTLRWWFSDDERIESYSLFWKIESDSEWTLLKGGIDRKESSIVVPLPQDMLYEGTYQVAVRSYNSNMENPFSKLKDEIQIDSRDPGYDPKNPTRTVESYYTLNVIDQERPMGGFTEKIVVAVSESFANNNPKWKEDAPHLIDGTNAIFARTTGKRYLIEKFVTYPVGEEKFEDIVDQLKYRVMNEHGVRGTSVFISDKTAGRNDGELNAYMHDGERIAIVRLFPGGKANFWNENKWPITLAHELGHAHGLGLMAEWYSIRERADDTRGAEGYGRYIGLANFAHGSDPMTTNCFECYFSPYSSYLIDKNSYYDLRSPDSKLIATLQKVQVLDESFDPVPFASLRIYSGIMGGGRLNEFVVQVESDQQGIAQLPEKVGDYGAVLLEGEKGNMDGKRFFTYVDRLERNALFHELDESVYELVITEKEKYPSPRAATHFTSSDSKFSFSSNAPFMLYWTSAPISVGSSLPGRPPLFPEVSRLRFREKGTQTWHEITSRHGFIITESYFLLGSDFLTEEKTYFVSGKTYEFMHQWSDNSIIEGAEWSEGKIVEIIVE